MTDQAKPSKQGGAGQEIGCTELSRNLRSTAKKLLPRAVLRAIQQYRAHTEDERSIYLKSRILEIGFKNPKVPSWQSIRSIVFICYGNIIRSPMCEALMKRALTVGHNTQIAVTSAGLNATPDRPAHPWAIAAAREFGISLEGHRARALTREMVSQADAIFAMDYQNKVQLLSRWPESNHKVYMLSAYAGARCDSGEIPDPYYLGEEQTGACYSVLNICIQNLANHLSSHK